MAKTLTKVSFVLLPDVLGGTYTSCAANYTVGSTDDPEFNLSKTMTIPVTNPGDLNKIQALWASWVTQVKTTEGIK